MNSIFSDRRSWLQSAGLLGLGAVTASPSYLLAEDARVTVPKTLRYCLNMSTIRGQQLSVPDQVDLAAKAGYDSIEPWMGDLRKYEMAGGSLKDLAKRITDHGLKVDSAIGFAEWIVDDDAKRAKGLEAAKSDMELIHNIGGTHIAAPPAGATKQTDLDLLKAAERYAALLKLGVAMAVIPQIEVWGFSTVLSKLGETMLVAVESKHPAATILADVYHLHKGGSEFHGLGLIAGSAMHCFHMNDYPADPPRATIADKDRVYPGDGVAPLTSILKTLFANGFAGTLSLELFNPEYWKQDALLVARTGLEKMKAAVAKC
ncbi:sugar phosphate isomerase/epimerase family protein [Anatilimnocola floriformis]|uniref:sugar phosphate isomerase/epimerase family protein n=1 Tax=Anatilimnocola floriformis TaxID=2948575 RepID=UPI0020C4A0CB|nr:sugar phosphate isomerase/epimerase family protein [Anatilimnocola floriformis]